MTTTLSGDLLNCHDLLTKFVEDMDQKQPTRKKQKLELPLDEEKNELPVKECSVMIVQQTNCLTTTAHGLSDSIAKRWPSYADVYGKRKGYNNVAFPDDRSKPGTIVYCKPDTKEEKDFINKNPIIACFMAQYAPGSCNRPYPKYSKILLPKPDSNTKESNELRTKWFQICLDKLLLDVTHQKIFNFDQLVVALPYKIGSGLANGSWLTYKEMIDNFTNKLPQDVYCVIVQRPEDK